MNDLTAYISLSYDGDAVKSGRMDVYEAAPNMMAFSQFMVIAAKICYGSDIDVKAHVRGYAKGSFETDLAFVIAGSGLLSQMIASYSEAHLWEIAKGAMLLFNHLAGKKPTKIINNGNKIDVVNNNGQILQVNTESLTLVLNRDAGKAAERFVGKALSAPGIETLKLTHNNDKTMVGKKDAEHFKPIDIEESVSDNTIMQTLILESAAFRESLQWRFSDGERSFSAQMADEEFLKRLDNGERFGKGDRLTVEMKIEQVREGETLKLNRSILKVLDHRDAASQSVILY